MGEAFITRRGGGAKAFAVIGVTYPAGSVCTCTDGTKTLTLKDTSGQGFFLIPYAGTWTVMCYDGADYDSSENKDSKVVEITAEGQSESVDLAYGVYWVKDGVAKVEFTLTNFTISTSDGELIAYYQGSGYHHILYKSDLANYSRMEIEIWNESGEQKLLNIYPESQINLGVPGTVAYAEIPISTGYVKHSLDISELGGQKYQCSVLASGNTTHKLRIKNWMLYY